MRQLIYLTCLAAAIVVTATAEPQSSNGVGQERPQDAGVTIAPDVFESSNDMPSVAVYSVRARGWSSTRQAIYANAVAVAVDGKLIGPGHLVDGMYGTPVVEAEIDGSWQRLAWQRDAKRDMLTIAMDGVAGSNSRLPVYGERVIVHAHATDAAMCGTVFSVDPLYIGLDSSEIGIKSGDSGSPIVSEFGDVLGIVTGFRATPYNGEPRSIVGEPVLITPAAVSPAVASPAVGGPQQPGTSSSNCPTGVCPSPSQQYYQPQRRGLFRWR